MGRWSIAFPVFLSLALVSISTTEAFIPGVRISHPPLRNPLAAQTTLKSTAEDAAQSSLTPPPLSDADSTMDVNFESTAADKVDDTVTTGVEADNDAEMETEVLDKDVTQEIVAIEAETEVSDLVESEANEPAELTETKSIEDLISSEQKSSDAADTETQKTEEIIIVEAESDKNDIIELEAEAEDDLSIESPATMEEPNAVVEEKISEKAAEIPPPELSVEEKISSSVASTAFFTLGAGSRSVFLDASQTIREAKSKNQKRLSRSSFEKQKAAEKIAKIKARMEKQVAEVDAELKVKLDDVQLRLDEEINRVTATLSSKVKLEAKRAEKILELISSIQLVIESKEKDIEDEEAITKEMTLVRSKLKEGVIASQLDELLAKKKESTSAELVLISDLEKIVNEVNTVLEESRSRASRIEEAVGCIVIPAAVTADEEPYDWTIIDEMEELLKHAADSALKSDMKIKQLKDHFDEAFLNKKILMGEEIPESLRTVAKKVTAQNKAVKTTAIAVNAKPSLKIDELKEKENAEIINVLAKSVGRAALDGAKVGVFGLKALLESVTGKDVTDAANEALEKSSGIGKGISGISDTIKTLESRGDLKKITENEDLKGSLKSTGDTLGAFGKAGKAIISNVEKSESSSQAQAALQETSQELLSALNALAALGVKNAKAIKDRTNEVNAELANKENDKK